MLVVVIYVVAISVVIAVLVVTHKNDRLYTLGTIREHSFYMRVRAPCMYYNKKAAQVAALAATIITTTAKQQLNNSSNNNNTWKFIFLANATLGLLTHRNIGLEGLLLLFVVPAAVIVASVAVVVIVVACTSCLCLYLQTYHYLCHRRHNHH